MLKKQLLKSIGGKIVLFVVAFIFGTAAFRGNPWFGLAFGLFIVFHEKIFSIFPISSGFAYKVFIFTIFYVVGAGVTNGNWFVGIVSAIIVLMAIETDAVYQKGKRVGRKDTMKD